MRSALCAGLLALAGLAAGAADAPEPAPARTSALARTAVPARVSAPAPAPAAATATHTPPGLALAPCRLPGLAHDALCGSLSRPLDPSRPQGRRILLQVAVLPALARQKAADAVMFFAGGPGQSAIALAGTVDRLLGRIGLRRDIVLVDQRGTGHSAPLYCDRPAADEAFSRVFEPARAVAALDACRQRLQALPWGDLRQYTTPIAAADAEAVRAALGVARLDLVGVSYGTRVALDYLRQFPPRVRRVVLDAVETPDMRLPDSAAPDFRAALQALFDTCAVEPDCAHRHPDLRAQWARLRQRLPRSVALADPATGQVRAVRLTPDALDALVRPGLYAPAFGAVLPQAIDDAAHERFGPLLALGLGLAPPGGDDTPDIAEGAHFSVVCSDDHPAASTDLAGGAPALYGAVCADWPRGTLPPGFRSVVRSRAPVLLLSGGLDPVTPPAHAQALAQGLGPLARAVRLPQGGHGSLALPCVHDAVVAFLESTDDRAALGVDLRCAAQVPAPRAFVPPQPGRAASAPNDPRSYATLGPPTAGGAR